MKIVVHVNPVLRPLGAACAALEGVESVAVDDTIGLAEALPGAQVLVLSNSTYSDAVAEVVARHGDALKWLQFTSIGVEAFERLGAPKGITVCNAAGLRTGAVAEHAMALLLTLSRRIVSVDRARASRNWGHLGVAAEQVTLLHGRTLLCLGYGSIGREVARLAKAFGMTVIACNRNGKGGPPADELVPLAQVQNRLLEADAVALCLPEMAETRGIIGAEALGRMKSGAVLVNVGRGTLVDAEALICALKAGTIGGAALDVFEPEPLPPDHPFWNCPNLVMTPHVAGNGGDTVAQLRDLLAEGLERFRRGAAPRNVVRAGTCHA